MHHCIADGRFAYDACGAAILSCIEDAEGFFWVGNDEYASQVAFCPYCGAKAPNQAKDERPERERTALRQSKA